MPASFVVPKSPAIEFKPIFINALPTPPDGKSYVVKERVSELLIRVTSNGAKTFIMNKRWPKSAPNASTRVISTIPALTKVKEGALAQARATARAWEELRQAGGDPAAAKKAAKVEEEKVKQVAADLSFAVVIQQYLAAKRNKGRRHVHQDWLDFKRDAIPVLKDKPITEITQEDIEKVISRILARGKKPGAKTDKKHQAFNTLTKLKAFFNWCIKRGKGKLERSPCRLIDSEEEVGKLPPRKRCFDRDELFAFLRAARRMPYPYGPLYQALILTGARLNEIKEASWPEVDVGNLQALTVPAVRFKADRINVIAFSADALAIVSGLPRFSATATDPRHYLFSHTSGSRPVNNMDWAKEAIDKRMIRTIRALARKRGDDPRAVSLAPWINHDLRRVVRSGLSELRVQPIIAELILGHKLPALWGTYDVHSYLDEKREALTAWATHLRIVLGEEPETNVVPFRRAN